MRCDLGPEGLAVLLAISLGFGVFAQLVAGRATSWTWLIATTLYFLLGLFISEVWFGWATQAELQPNIGGLSFDEVLLGLVPGVAAVLAVRYLVRRGGRGAR